MKWYYRDFIGTAFTTSLPRQVRDFINGLNDLGISPDHIKLLNITNDWVVVYYYNNKEV